MTYYIFNHDIDKSQIAVEAMNINAEEILWQGTKEEFESLGFNESQVGGFELVNDQLLFNQELFNSSQKQKLPIATGKNLVSFIEKAFAGQDFIERMQLQSLFFSIKLTLESETCNPLSENDFNAVIELVKQNQRLNDKQKQLFIQLGLQWKETVKF